MDKSRLPALISTGDKQSFAEFTIKVRKPKILERIIAENEYSEEIVRTLRLFEAEIQSGTISALNSNSPDREMWNKYSGKTWFELPWFYAETYFYRKVCEIIGYYDPDSENYLSDPFSFQKTTQMKHDVQGMCESGIFQKHEERRLSFEAYMDACLWGNRADLSNITVDLAHSSEELGGAEHLEKLIDDSKTVRKYLEFGLTKISIFVDNVGREFYSDLMFVDMLLRKKMVSNVALFVKPSPFFVSDVMAKDVELSIELLLESAGKPGVNFGGRIREYIETGKISILAPKVLGSSKMYQEMGVELDHFIQDSDLVIMKGDANYRRLLGDRKWAHTTKTEKIIDYLTVPLVTIRTLKAEIMTGMTDEQVQLVSLKENDWLISGNFGLVQYIERGVSKNDL